MTATELSRSLHSPRTSQQETENSPSPSPSQPQHTQRSPTLAAPTSADFLTRTQYYLQTDAKRQALLSENIRRIRVTTSRHSPPWRV